MSVLRIPRPVVQSGLLQHFICRPSPSIFLSQNQLISCARSFSRTSLLQQSGHNRRSPPGQYRPPSSIPQYQQPNHVSQTYTHHEYTEHETGPVRTLYLRPLIWAGTVAAGLYVGLAAFEVFSTKPPSRDPLWGGWTTQPHKSAPSGPAGVLKSAWDDLDSMSKVSSGIIAVNGAIALGERMANPFWTRLWHVPAHGRYYTLFTSSWVHGGILHLGFNMLCLFNFLPVVGNSNFFNGNPYEVSAFYLSTAVLSSYGQHFNSLWLKQSRYVMSGGASGAIYAVVAAFATLYPHSKMGFMFLPFSVDAQSMLIGLMTFDLVGVLGGLRWLHLGHGAHLTGALLGIAYINFDGYNNLWLPLTTFFKRVRSNERT